VYIMNYNFETLLITNPKPYIYHVQINRPDKLNAINPTMWREFISCFEQLSLDPNCRVVILSAAGRLFCAGIDLHGLMSSGQELQEAENTFSKAKLLESSIKLYQKSFSAIEKCTKPVIVCVHNACIGAGVDMITACDIRLCTEDAYFQVKEVAIGMAADVGTLQRLPKVIGNQSLVRELCLTARKMNAKEAQMNGLVSHVGKTKDEVLSKSFEIAEIISNLSPVAIQGTKKFLNYAQDHSIQQGLDAMADHNKFALQSEDFIAAVTAQMTKTTPIFSKL